jgi:hypothetical protein
MQVTTSLASGQVSVLPLGHGPVKLGLSSVRPSSLTFSHVYLKTKKPSYEYDIQCSCTCLYVMFDFITKVTLNNDILIFVHHKSMNIKLIQIIMDASQSRDRAVIWNRFCFYFYNFPVGFWN